MVDHFTYRVSWSPDDSEYAGACTEFPSLSHLAGSPEETLAGIRALDCDTVADKHKSREPVRQSIATEAFSGKFMTRVPTELHRALEIEAAEAGIGVSRLVSFRPAMSAPLRAAKISKRRQGGSRGSATRRGAPETHAEQSCAHLPRRAKHEGL